LDSKSRLEDALRALTIDDQGPIAQWQLLPGLDLSPPKDPNLQNCEETKDFSMLQ
jgi:hypothetical protein